ncbi:hypothetical protein ABH926_000203 [Catenulispora sp. GP43]|uniref:hypothetical protein n=1 Tax=Catenulispora sp. GP43 TaxID=3156263 RepID=UPI0035164074
MRLRTAVSVGIAAAALTLPLLGGCSRVSGDSPKSVEDDAAKMVTDSLGALTPAVTQTVRDSKWSPCSEETPGVHRSEYQRVVDFDVAQADAQRAIGQITAEWGKKGYTTKPQAPGDPRASALGKGDWTLLVGVETDGSQMFLTVDSGCVNVSSDPKSS